MNRREFLSRFWKMGVVAAAAPLAAVVPAQAKGEESPLLRTDLLLVTIADHEYEIVVVESGDRRVPAIIARPDDPPTPYYWPADSGYDDYDDSPL